MLKDLAYMGLYGTIIVSLILVDYTLGNGLIDMIQKLMCKITCFLRKSIREEIELTKNEDPQIPVHFSTLFVELLVLVITRMVLNKYKLFNKGKDRLDELLHESKEALRLTDEFLEKWRMRRLPTESSYLDEEPQEIKPLKLEVPILHMAIIDARGSSRKQIDRADAGDSLTYSDPAILSVVSLVEDNDTTLVNKVSDDFDINTDIQNRYLWDVEEEDPNVEY